MAFHPVALAALLGCFLARLGVAASPPVAIEVAIEECGTTELVFQVALQGGGATRIEIGEPPVVAGRGLEIRSRNQPASLWVPSFPLLRT